VTHRVLVVDDEPDITALVAYHLAKAGFRVSTAANGPDALKAAREERPDVIILDVMLPGVSGYDVLAELRRQDETRDVGVIMLTARREEADRIRGLSLGADDYLTKPFSMAELLARVKALLRRAALLRQAQNQPAAGSTLRNGELEIAVARRDVRVRGQPVELTALEFDLLLHFAQHPGLVFSRAQLLDARGPVVEPRGRRQDGGPRLGRQREVPQVHQRQRRLPRHQHQGTALLQRHVRSPLDE